VSGARPLSREQVAAELDRIRVEVIGAKYHDFCEQVPWADLEDAYGNITADALACSFASFAELGAYVHVALRRDALDIVKSPAFRLGVPLSGEAWKSAAGIDEGPERAAVASEARDRLHEFVAELSEQDRRIALLSLDPAFHWPPRRIAKELRLSHREVAKTLERVWSHMARLTAMELVPGAVCSRRRRDVVRWQQTGQCPRALTLHCYRCASCRAQVRHAREAARSAILPLIPAGGLPLAAPGAIARLYHAAVAHPVTQRINDAHARIRRTLPIGDGGAAAVAVKLAATGAVLTAGVALHAATSGHASAHHGTPVVIRARAHIAAAPPPATTTATTTAPTTTSTATATTTTTATTSTSTSAPAATTTATPTPAPQAPAQAPAATTTTPPATTTTQAAAVPPAPDQNNAAPAPTPATATTDAANDNAQTSPPPSAPTSSGGTTGGSSADSSSGSQNGPAAPGGPPPP